MYADINQGRKYTSIYVDLNFLDRAYLSRKATLVRILICPRGYSPLIYADAHDL